MSKCGNEGIGSRTRMELMRAHEILKNIYKKIYPPPRPPHPRNGHQGPVLRIRTTFVWIRIRLRCPNPNP